MRVNTPTVGTSPSRHVAGSEPYPWPHDGSLLRQTTALVLVDMQQDCRCCPTPFFWRSIRMDEGLTNDPGCKSVVQGVTSINRATISPPRGLSSQSSSGYCTPSGRPKCKSITRGKGTEPTCPV